jgi:hypothetical protein
VCEYPDARMNFCVTEGGKRGEMCFFIDRLNINFRSQFLLSLYLPPMNVEVLFFISFFRCIRHATFFSSLIGTMSNERRTRRQNQIHLTSFYPRATVSYFAITSLSPRHLSVWIFLLSSQLLYLN